MGTLQLGAVPSRGRSEGRPGAPEVWRGRAGKTVPKAADVDGAGRHRRNILSGTTDQAGSRARPISERIFKRSGLPQHAPSCAAAAPPLPAPHAPAPGLRPSGAARRRGRAGVRVARRRRGRASSRGAARRRRRSRVADIRGRQRRPAAATQASGAEEARSTEVRSGVGQGRTRRSERSAVEIPRLSRLRALEDLPGSGRGSEKSDFRSPGRPGRATTGFVSPRSAGRTSCRPCETPFHKDFGPKRLSRAISDPPPQNLH